MIGYGALLPNCTGLPSPANGVVVVVVVVEGEVGCLVSVAVQALVLCSCFVHFKCPSFVALSGISPLNPPTHPGVTSHRQALFVAARGRSAGSDRG